jgi:hypothetical protein
MKSCQGLVQDARYIAIVVMSEEKSILQPWGAQGNHILTHRKRFPHSLPIRVDDVRTLRILGCRTLKSIGELKEVVQHPRGVGVNWD